MELCSCVGVKPYNKAFVEKYGNENFDAFTNVGIAIRGLDQERNFMLFIGDLKDAAINGPYIVTIDKQSGEIKKTSCHLMKDTSNLDKPIMNELALRFMKYDINLLRVDSSKNVYINVVNNERPTLIRFADAKYKMGQYSTGWRKIKDLWYEDKNY